MSARFAIVPARAVEDQRLGNAALRVLCCLGTYSDKDGWCRPSMRTLAARLGISRQTTIEHLKSLSGLGYIETKRRARPDGGDAANEYRLLFDRALVLVKDAQEGGQDQPTPPVSEIPTGGAGPADRRVGSEPTPRVGSEPTPILKNAPIERTLSPTVSDLTATWFETFWQVFPSRRPHNNPKPPARKKFAAVVKSGVEPAAIVEGAKRYAAYVQREGVIPKYRKQAVTWLGEDGWTENHEPEQVQPMAGMV